MESQRGRKWEYTHSPIWSSGCSFRYGNSNALRWSCPDSPIVPKNSTRKSTLHQHFAKFAAGRSISSQSTRHIPLLSRSLPFCQQSLLLCSGLSAISLRPMPRSMYQASTINPRLPNILQPDTWEISVSNLCTSS
jgi:hypothetical protein